MNQTTISIVRGLLCPGFYDRIFKILIIFLLISALSANRVSAQDRSFPNGVAIGETVPDFFWTKEFKGADLSASSNSTGKLKTFSLGQFKGKLIILDFWATYCAPCIHGFSNMKDLQRIFSGEIEVIQVNNESGDMALNLLFKRKKDQDESFTNILSDTLLYKLFPFKTIPHYVWINGEGKVIATTGSEEIDSLKISKVLHNQRLSFVNKINVDTDRHLFTTKDLPVSNLLKFNILLKGRLSGLGTGTSFKIDSASKTIIGQTITNMPLKKIYSMIARQLFKAEKKIFSQKRIVFDGDSSGIAGSAIYNYEFDVPLSRASDLHRLMIEDLNTYSPYFVTFEKRNLTCFFLERTRPDHPFTSTPSTERYIKTFPNPTGQLTVIDISNYPPSVLSTSLENSEFVKYPVIDSTGTATPISVQIDLSADLNKQLEKFGLRIREGKAMLDVMVISDQPGTKQSNSN